MSSSRITRIVMGNYRDLLLNVALVEDGDEAHVCELSECTSPPS